MTGTSLFAAATEINLKSAELSSFMAFDHQRIATDQQQQAVVARSPANKKIKLSTTFNSPLTPTPHEATTQPQQQPNGTAGDVKMGGTVDDKGVQTTTIPVADSSACQVGVRNSSSSCSAPDRTPSLQSIRATIQEQFDIEILLKHRELGNIEKEIAKTQVAMEQLRRCSLIPYVDSMEAQLHAQLNYKPPSSNPHNIPDYAPPPEGVVDGPYTRHYRQWLISHQRFDGPNAPAYILPSPMTPGVAMHGMHQSLTGSGRPQRQSAMKVQTKNGEQVCLYRKRDGVLVRLECGDCHRSNFSSAQGFINHCRIAHQTEYSSHDAAADACGQEVNEEEQAALVSPMFRAAIDGPARNTRQTNQSKAPALPTPPSSFHSRASFSDAPPSYQNATPRAQPTPASTTQRKGGRRAAMTVNTPITPAPQSKSGSSLAMSPTDFNTTNLESHLKRKRPDINVEGLLKEVTEILGNGKASPQLPSVGFHKPPVPQRTPVAARLPTPTSQEPIAPVPRHSSPALRRPMSSISPIPSQIKTREIKPQRVSADGDVEMHDFDASSSDDDDDGGYRSDGVQGHDDDLYSVPPRRPMQGEALEFRNGESSTFGSMLSGSTGLFNQFSQVGPTSAAVPSLPMSSFTLQNGGTTLLNGGGIAPTVSYTPSVTINPAVLMRGGGGDHSTPSPTSMMSMVNMTAALLNQSHQHEPEIPKHVRFAIPGIGGDLRHQEGVNGASG
ncbi:hypothetical protein K440DRAFT_127731 [Wilcoxina mikolae CBS 423.85]|nr:hypothetical protein K440DRAFT_127731 [Wilcoxina mikolae CBS 423.85]